MAKKYIDKIKGRLYGTKHKVGVSEGPITTTDLAAYLSTYSGHDVEIKIKPKKQRGMKP